MKKTELKGCPQWLIDADTQNEDVVLDGAGNLIWLGGNFRGGYFLGSYFLGGYFLGGYFLGGDFRDGYFLGGYFLGGDFRGGNFLGGYFLGGDFRGGNFLGGYFLGEKISKDLVILLGGRWTAIVTPTMMHIGCQHHPHASWKAFTPAEIDAMSEGATEFWGENKEALLLLCDREAAK